MLNARNDLDGAEGALRAALEAKSAARYMTKPPATEAIKAEAARLRAACGERAERRGRR